MIPAGKRDAVLGVLDDEGIDYAMSDETSGREYTAVVTFPLPTNAVEPVLSRLREAGIERNAYTVVLDAETVVSQRFEQLEARYAEENRDTERIAREELITRARELAPQLGSFVAMTIISAVVATSGLLLDSPAVVVGSMVIAPLIGPAMATSVGSVIDDEELFTRGVKLQVLGGLLAVASAALFAIALRYSGTVPLSAHQVFALSEVKERLAPDVLSLAIAVGAGGAGALSLASGVSSALVGVMIAAALMPPTAVVGIGIAWGTPTKVLGSAVLVLVNYLSINFAALAVLWYKGYRPNHWFRRDEARRDTMTRMAAIGGSLLLLSALLVGVTAASYQSSTFEKRARGAVANVAQSNGLSLIGLNVEYQGFPIRRPSNVTVTLGYRPGTTPPPVGTHVARVVRTHSPNFPALGSSGPIPVRVRYVAVECPSATNTSTTCGRTNASLRLARVH